MSEYISIGECLFPSVKRLSHDATVTLLIDGRKRELVGSDRLKWKTPVDDLIAESSDPYIRGASLVIYNSGIYLLPRAVRMVLSLFDQSKIT